MPKLPDAISNAVEACHGHVSIADAIRRVRELVSTRLSDSELEMRIGTVAAERGKAILFDRLKA